ncbi:thioesterase family protein [Chachezhania sediminis]|uniref:thioesterase family protein n=1 Tax=Chachezhania sediminis TaxID=2599291 RepID=UPI00131CE938|nr:thioesterase family protein [Chachezhania sediminis]
MTTVLAAPFTSDPMTVKPEWIDYNGHLNMAYYNVIFDTGVDKCYEAMGFGPDYAATRKLTTYTAEFHVRYVREIHEGDIVTVTTQLIDFDDKRIHTYQEIIHSDGWVAATAEGLGLHIDMTGPKVAPMPEDVYAKVKAMHEAHAALPRPASIGKPIGIRRK